MGRTDTQMTMGKDWGCPGWSKRNASLSGHHSWPTGRKPLRAAHELDPGEAILMHAC